MDFSGALVTSLIINFYIKIKLSFKQLKIGLFLFRKIFLIPWHNNWGVCQIKADLEID